jgi:hypothetical protein
MWVMDGPFTGIVDENAVLLPLRVLSYGRGLGGHATRFEPRVLRVRAFWQEAADTHHIVTVLIAEPLDKICLFGLRTQGE